MFDLVPWIVSASLAGILVYITNRDTRKEYEALEESPSHHEQTVAYMFADVQLGDSFRDWRPLTFDFKTVEERVCADLSRVADELGDELGYKNMGNMLWSMRDTTPPRQITKIERTFWDALVGERLKERLRFSLADFRHPDVSMSSIARVRQG